jgi:DNA-binding NarL/FixJ family response regulator
MPEIDLVAEASNGREAIAAIEAHRPDIALLDINMPILNGLEAAKEIATRWPDVRVIMLSMHESEEHVSQALHAGVVGYVLKHADINELEIALRAVSRGSSYLSPAVSHYLMRDFRQRVNNSGDPLDHLTPRQRQVLQLIAEGQTTQKIAHILGLSVKTVETHRAALMKRLNIYDVPGLTRYALRMKMVE